MFHTGGLLVYTMPLMILGGTVVLMRKFDPDAVLDLIEREHVTMFFGVPTMYQMMTHAPNFARRRSQQPALLHERRRAAARAAGREVPRPKGVRLQAGLRHDRVRAGHLRAGAGRRRAARPAASGRPNFFVDARIVDDDNQPLSPNTMGELVLKGPSMCSGYFNNPEASQAAIDADGWFHTGDLARIDDDGFFFIVDRKKDMFISGGENVYPVEIEKALYEHPAVAQCAVIGVPDEKWGEVGKAIVVLEAQRLRDGRRIDRAHEVAPRQIQSAQERGLRRRAAAIGGGQDSQARTA